MESTAEILPCSMLFSMLNWISVIAVRGECFALPPWWLSWITLFSFRNGIKCNRKNSSNIFSSKGKLLIGRKESGRRGSLSGLLNGNIFDSLKIKGKVLVLMIELIK